MVKKILAFLLCLMMLLPAAVAEEAAPLLEVHQMKLGVADGYFIRLGDIEIMIDGGNPRPKQKNEDVINYLRDVGADKLDAHIITHWHLDHCMNINAILTEFGDENTVVYSPSTEVPQKVTGDTNNSVTVQIAPLAAGTHRQMVMGDVIQIGPITITCIGPETVKYNGKQNVDSLNFVLQYGTRRFLFTGDYAQSGCINNHFKELCSDVDVLKFPHHAIETSNGGYEISTKAMKTVSPEYVLVPSGKNNYKIWQFVNSYGGKIPRENVMTNSEDVVVIVTDGGELFEARIEQNPADYAPKAN